MGKRKKRDENSENWSNKNDFPIEEVWGTYHYIARDIVSRLKAFKALDKHGYAPDFKDITAWNNAIQKMIDAFELVQPNKVVYCDDYPAIYEGLDLFRKYFLNLRD
jgi:hypothetical protein